MKKAVLFAIACLGLIPILASSQAYATTLVTCPSDGLTDAQCAALSENRLDYSKPSNVVWNIVQFILLLLGGVAVIMIIIGGIQYATSQGESAAISKAKNTILYAVIGLVVALSAAGIVTFITNSILK